MFHPDCDPRNDLEIFKNLDWHKESAPYEIAYDDSEGRYLKATRDIKKGELILEENSLIRGPAKPTLPVCLGCYTELDKVDFRNLIYLLDHTSSPNFFRGGIGPK